MFKCVPNKAIVGQSLLFYVILTGLITSVIRTINHLTMEKTESILFKLSKKDKQTIYQLAKSNRISMSSYIRQTLLKD